ncbi:polysaccharide biosynthesis/export family protein [Aureimonas jatrophae]|uniref:Polysaccharide export outer membrane protein n=1 Tax=Aureimonas jatrophae TaxID=1166073 RepID=A0A1H0ND06_9HYPH|nr:polysaccharide biosynthesis/export family protein [Aureimonas jatrophae]MBB3951174.1 polysaccharide export outer membrane protein [Aureimonas jatrophae]SDO90533.1 polysaccharide export outer membrane protein [Aureimonas jatrophae]
MALGTGWRCSGLIAVALGLSACNTLPRSGPDDKAIRENATLYFAAPKSEKPLLDYMLIDLTPDAISYFEQKPRQTLAAGFGASRRGPPSLPLGIGDIVEVSIFESAQGGLFVPADAGSRPGNFVTLPRQTIDTDGTLSVPYAGRVRASGRTPTAVQAEIEQRLADRAIEPQVVINLIESRSSQVSVLGDVNAPAKFEVTPGGDRILDVISRAGGISASGAETYISLQRNNTSATVLFDTLLERPSENIYVYPGDTIFANRERRTYLAFGASGLNGRIDFEESNLTLAEAVGKAGGLLDAAADPGQIFLYRLVDPEILARMGAPVTAKAGKGFPVIFRANLRDPSTYFLAQRFAMEDKDILYVSNADSVELLKVLNIISSTTQTVSGSTADVVLTRDATRAIRD